MEQWEYAVDLIQNRGAEVTLRHFLNWRGSEGWELVSLAPRVKPFMGEVQGGDLIAVFKRPGLGKFDAKVVEPPLAY
jgi:hypothetical protein